MAPKRPNPMEEPPAASSEEDEHSSSGEEEEADEQNSSSGEEEEDDELAAPPASTGKNFPSRPDSKTLAPGSARPEQPQSSDDKDDASETESDSDAPPSVNVKPIASKPMEKEAPQPSKSRSKPAPPPAKSPAKRPSAPEPGQKEAKRTKKENGLPEAAKKAPFQRVWSEEDEIIVLKGMLDYSKMKGTDPLTQIADFYEFIKRSLQVDFSRTQLVDKIKRLKKKYNNSLGKGKKGEDPTFTKSHERKSFDLAKMVWGNEGVVLGLESTTVSNGKARKNQNPKDIKASTSLLKPEPIPSADGNKGSIITKNEKELAQCSSNPNFLDEMTGMGGFEESITTRVIGRIDEAKKAELEKKLRKLKIAELELYLERQALIGEQAKLLLAHYKSLDK